jgi:hypothetical protein
MTPTVAFSIAVSTQACQGLTLSSKKLLLCLVDRFPGEYRF